ncbi:MAG: BamA/TamA family outer membrane protein [Polyangiaceae bacterium]
MSRVLLVSSLWELWKRSCAAALVCAVVVIGLAGCHHERPERLPGETDILVTSVEIESSDGRDLKLAHAELFMLLGLRKGNALVTHRYFNEFRLAEDRRRLVSWWQSFGYFDVEVEEPKLTWAPDKKSVAVQWRLKEGQPYHIGSVTLRHVPEEHRAAIAGLVPFKVGDTIDLEEYRLARMTMAEHLQRQGFGHAKVFSRTWVDKEKKQLHWFYLADPGPKTRIGKVVVEGAHRIPEQDATWRAGLRSGEPYSLALKEKAELDMVDSGSYASAAIKPDADVDRVLPGDRPDTGGDISDAQVDAEGNLIPRKLDDVVNMRLVVVEAPRVQLRMRAGAEADPTRGDAYVGARLWLRDVFGPYHHLIFDGRVGYGLAWSDDEDELSGPYGEALARYVKSGMFGRIGDFRLSGRYRDLLYPGFQLREIAAGPGIRSTLAPGFFLEFDALFRYETTAHFGGFTDAVRDQFDLPADDTKLGELSSSLVWDARNDPVEARSGHLMQLALAGAPGGALGTERYLRLDPELRGYVPFGPNWSLGARLSGAWVLLDDGAVPVSVRTFGGGAFDHRGFGRLRLSPEAPCAPGASCTDEFVGGKSQALGSVELRFLPFRKQFGLAVFGDAGGVGTKENPLEDGVAAAVGFGPRLRLWYLPIAVDFSARVLNHGETEPFDEWSTYLLFLRIGEAF